MARPTIATGPKPGSPIPTFKYGLVFGQDLHGVLEHMLKKKVVDYYYDKANMVYGARCSDGSVHRLLHYAVETVAKSMYDATMAAATPTYGYAKDFYKTTQEELHRHEQELEYILTAALAIQTKIDELKKELENGTD